MISTSSLSVALRVLLLFATLCSLCLVCLPAPIFAVDEQTAATEPVGAPDKVIYLTFDDGPRNPYTQQILDVLAKHNAKATFFVVGRLAAAHPEMLESIYAAGHGLANHSYSHRSLMGLGWETFRAEVEEGRNALSAYPNVCLRPPYGKMDGNTAAFAVKMGYHVVLWSIDPRDWALPGAEAIAQRVVNNAHPGAVVVLHDGGGDRSQTVAALELILIRLGQQGYAFASMCRDGALPPLLPGVGLPVETGPNGLKSPASHTKVAGEVMVTGVAVHPEFIKWQLDLLLYGDESQAIFLALGETPLSAPGELLLWNTTLYPDGPHQLRLRVVRRGGNYDEYYSPIFIANN